MLTNYTTSNPLKIMPVGDSITDDCSINGAWRLYLQPLLQTNGYAFTNLGRWLSSPTSTFTKTRHEGICGAVIAYPGMFGYHTYPTLSNCAQKTLMDALTNYSPDLFLIDLGVNDMGYGRNPYLVATNHMATLLDSIFAKVPAAHIIVGKPTTITGASIGSPPYSTYGTNMPIYCAALQSMINARQDQGQNVSFADLFSVVDGATMMQSDGTHPNAAGLSAMAREWSFRIAAITVRTNMVMTPLIRRGSTWKYSDQGLDLGTNWAQPQHDDSAWAFGPARLGYNAPGISTTLGFGTNSASKYITTYFRRAFVAPDSLHYTNLNVRLNRADGAVVWLNGRELLRVNLATGPITYQSRATTPIVGDRLHIYFQTNLPVGFLPSGTNVVAVEVHKFAPASVNLSFDMELFGLAEFAPPMPPLTALFDKTNLILRWPVTNNAGFALFAGTDLSWPATWSPLGGPYILNRGYYEYREPVASWNPATFYSLRYVGSPATGPRLRWAVGSNVLGLSWAADFAGFDLESCDSFPPADTWHTVAGPYTFNNDGFQVILPSTSATQQFFRLNKPSF